MSTPGRPRGDIRSAPHEGTPVKAPRRPLRARRRSRGFGLIEALVALALLAFGLLAMTRFQTRMIAGATETQGRLNALQFADELIASVLVDPANAACYTLPRAGGCTSATAGTRTDEWAARVAAALPGTVTTVSTLDGATGRLRVAISWTGKESGEARTLEATTDAR